LIAPLLPTYARADLAFERGEGAWLFGTDGKRYLDFSGGVAVNALGHAHPALVKALTEQAQKVWHVSNLFRIPEAERLAKRLVDASFADTVFFANSGAEAMECAIKMARIYHAVSGKPEKSRFITFDGSFHGRTLATLAAAGNQKYLDGFGEPMPGFDQVRYGDLEAVKKAITPATGAILVEPIQGEGGIRVPPPSFLRALRELCDKNGLLLVLDEVQSGMGRTGKLFAYEWTGIEPDILATAKGIGGGFPLGACLASAEAAKGMTAGTHGSTFGGNPMAVAAGNAVLDVMLAPGFFGRVNDTAKYLWGKLETLAGKPHEVISGLCLRTPAWEELHREVTRVTFRQLTPRDLEHYLASGEWEGRAGAYAIQGLGASLVERIEGDYFAVMGLPIVRLVGLLRDVGIRYQFGSLSTTDK